MKDFPDDGPTEEELKNMDPEVKRKGIEAYIKEMQLEAEGQAEEDREQMEGFLKKQQAQNTPPKS